MTEWPALMQTQTAARYLDASRATILKLERQGLIKPVRPFGTETRMYRRADLDAYLASLIPAA